MVVVAYHHVIHWLSCGCCHATCVLQQVRYLKIADAGKAYNPYRWVRYVTQSSSYVARVA
jgi:hypothetical protein